MPAKAAVQCVTIREIEPGDFVRDEHGAFHEIATVHGVVSNGYARGGFSVVTAAGNTIDMWHARSYHKREAGEAPAPSQLDPVLMREAVIECIAAYVHAANAAGLPLDQAALKRWRGAVGVPAKSPVTFRRPSRKSLGLS